MFNRPPDSKVEEIFAKGPTIPDHVNSQGYVMLSYFMQLQASCDAVVPGFRERTASDRKLARRNELVQQCEQLAESLQQSAAVSLKPEPKSVRDARYANANRTISAAEATLREGRIDDALRPMTSEAGATFEKRIRGMPRDDPRELADAMAPYRFRIWIGSACEAAQATRDDTGDTRSVIEVENRAGNWIISAIRGPDFDR